MAIKFSQFVVQTNASALSHIVGYNGADNIQITPTDFINSIVPGGPFLPLAGGTMTGNIDFANTIQARFLTSANSVGLKIQSSNTDSFIDNEVGDISIRQKSR